MIAVEVDAAFKVEFLSMSRAVGTLSKTQCRARSDDIPLIQLMKQNGGKRDFGAATTNR